MMIFTKILPSILFVAISTLTNIALADEHKCIPNDASGLNCGCYAVENKSDKLIYAQTNGATMAKSISVEPGQTKSCAIDVAYCSDPFGTGRTAACREYSVQTSVESIIFAKAGPSLIQCRYTVNAHYVNDHHVPVTIENLKTEQDAYVTCQSGGHTIIVHNTLP